VVIPSRRKPSPRSNCSSAEGRPPTLYAFEVDRAGRGRLLVLSEHRDAFGGEDEPPVTITWPWPATITDVFGQTRTVHGRDGQIRLPVSITPVTGQPPAAGS
jgi:hypothetical protein